MTKQALLEQYIQQNADTNPFRNAWDAATDKRFYTPHLLPSLTRKRHALTNPIEHLGGEWNSDFDRYQRMVADPRSLRNAGMAGGAGIGGLAGAGLGGMLGGGSGALIGGALGTVGGGALGSFLNRSSLVKYPWLAKLLAGASATL